MGVVTGELSTGLHHHGPTPTQERCPVRLKLRSESIRLPPLPLPFFGVPGEILNPFQCFTVHLDSQASSLGPGPAEGRNDGPRVPYREGSREPFSPPDTVKRPQKRL